MIFKLGNVDRVSSYPSSNQKLIVELEGVSEASVLNYMDIDVVIAHFGKAALLEKIGRDEAVKQFKIQVKENRNGEVQRRAQSRTAK